MSEVTGTPKPRRSRPKVAIVHDWLPLYGGAERVLEQIVRLFPDADLFSMVDLIPEGQRGFLLNKPVTTSFIQRLPKWAHARYRSFLPLMPCAVEQFDLSSYDLVISSSYAVVKGVITGPNQLHVCYCHSPMRYAWDLQSQYLREAKLTNNLRGLLARVFLHYLRMWDSQSQQRVDHFLTNSHFVGKRIKKVYRRDAAVVYPPVAVENFAFTPKKQDYYLTASRMVPYKMIGLVVDAFAQMPDRELRVIGDGPEFESIRRRASTNVKMLGFQPNEVLRRELQSAKAFVFAAEEDFGILPVEAQACGTPVIAYNRGGLRETVVSGETGVFFREQTVADVCAAVREFEAMESSFDPAAIRRNAERFSVAKFRQGFCAEIAKHWREFSGGEELEFAPANDASAEAYFDVPLAAGAEPDFAPAHAVRT